MKNQRALSRLESWLESYLRELYELLEVEESIQRVEQIAKTLRAADDWLTEWKAENPSLVTWFEKPDELNRRDVISLCLDEEKSQDQTGRNRWRSKLRAIERCSVGVFRCREKVLRDHEDKLWKIPDPPPTHNDESAAIVARLKVLNKWLDWRGGLRCVTRIVERIHRWEEIETDGTDYHSPIHESDDDRIDGRLTDEHLDLVGAIGSLASLIIEANRYDETELLGIVESDPNTYRFTYLDDLRWEYEQNHEKPVEPRRLEKLLRCGSCCESYPWNGEYPYRCPKCEADKRERDVVTKSKSEMPKTGETPDVVGSGPKSKRSNRGPKPKRMTKEERELQDKWNSGWFKTHEQLDAYLRLPPKTTKHKIEALRKRAKRAEERTKRT
jgi:hypothetical protein